MKKWLLILCVVSTLQASGNTPFDWKGPEGLMHLCKAPTPGASAESQWQWEDRKSVKHSRNDLDQILLKNRQWLATKGKEGERAVVNDARFPGADLREDCLITADFSSVDLNGANLNAADLSWADFRQANLAGTTLIAADLVYTNLSRADLSKASLFGADLQGAKLDKANLSGAVFTFAHMDGANLSGANLEGAHFDSASLAGAIYEPAKYTTATNIAQAQGLGYLKWSDSTAIFALRKSLFDAGFLSQARQVTAAIHRNNQNVLERLCFDWTCEWGANWLRPLKIAGGIFLNCALIYWIGMRFGKKDGLYLVATDKRIATENSKTRVARIVVGSSRENSTASQLGSESISSLAPKALLHRLMRRLRWEKRALSTAMLFSLTSVLNLGFEGFDFGRWIRMMQPREFDIKAYGWMRTVSGIQSIIGLALVALALLSYFGHPFD